MCNQCFSPTVTYTEQLGSAPGNCQALKTGLEHLLLLPLALQGAVSHCRGWGGEFCGWTVNGDINISPHRQHQNLSLPYRPQGRSTFLYLNPPTLLFSSPFTEPALGPSSQN